MRIRNLALSALVGLSSTVVVPGDASAQILTAARCSNAFGVSQTQAQGRYAWGLYCRANPAKGVSGPLRPSKDYLTDESITDYNSATDTLKARLFPAYFDMVRGAIWDIPDSALAQPSAPPQPAKEHDCIVLPAPAINVGLCVAGCYVPETPLQFAGAELGIKSATDSGRLDLVTLTPESTIDAPRTTINKVERYTVSLRDDVETIYSLQMKSGGSLRVTSEHPLLTSDGVMRQAKALKVGSELVRTNGTPDPIVAIGVARVYGKVYNVQPVSVDYSSNIVIAAGYLNGSVRFQNEFLERINAVILRRALSKLVK